MTTYNSFGTTNIMIHTVKKPHHFLLTKEIKLLSNIFQIIPIMNQDWLWSPFNFEISLYLSTKFKSKLVQNLRELSRTVVKKLPEYKFS